ncbi:MAG: hypothetical protein CMM01_01000 [Rhodopirellula sp.]|nr:hypothetical protein [Rhodopirellula sp.]
MSGFQLSRRSVLASASVAAFGGIAASCCGAVHSLQSHVRQITHGPKHHWFGYYDKLQFDPTSRFVLGMQVDFEHRSPKPEDQIEIGMIDLERDNTWVKLGKSNAWCWQQGCMLQWLPGSLHEVIWNDREDGQFISRIMNVVTGKMRRLPCPIYSVSPDGKYAVAPDFRRINDVRPGYGYAGLADPHADDPVPEASGIVRIDLQSGKTDLILSLADIARMGSIPNQKIGIKHYFNHLLFSPDGKRFIALHRWRYPDGSRLTRAITANSDGSDVRIVCPNGYTSHFIWRDSTSILAQSRNWDGNDGWGNFLFEDIDGGGDVREVGRGVLDPSGHISYLPGGKWILNDTYPKTEARMQTPHLYEVASGKRIDLAKFHLPAAYTGEWRVDTHPRFSPDGTMVCVDAPVGNQGRQLHLIDISDTVNKK